MVWFSEIDKSMLKNIGKEHGLPSDLFECLKWILTMMDGIQVNFEKAFKL